jgi:hypothetical protein
MPNVTRPQDDRTFALGTLSIADRPEEHIVWQREVESYLWVARSNVRGICEHGFTEMLNNAVDHSSGSTVTYIAEHKDRTLIFSIRDDGIGIFEKIKSHLGLEDYRQAMLELAKGKLTTDKSRHSGEGIFFTSRMFDRFFIWSNGIGFSHDAGQDDWLIEDEAFDGPGTRVVMIIAVDSGRTAREVFDMFSDIDSGDFSFSKTHVPLKLAKYGTGGLVSRSEAKRVLARFDGFKEVLLDFAGIESIGQAFADEIFRVFKSSHPDIDVIAIRANERVQNMIDRARKEAATLDALPLTVPTTKELLQSLKHGSHLRAMIPVPAGKNLVPGDRVVFAEATFDSLGMIPNMSPNGDSVTVILSKAEDTGGTYGTMRIFGIGWAPIPGGTVMQDIATHFDGQVTGRSSKVNVEPRQGHLLIWLLKWGDDGAHPHVPVAQVRLDADGYKVVLLHGGKVHMSEEVTYTDQDTLFAAIHSAIQVKDAEQ